ncbi:hypothetical protein [Foetidibacter luteolus]|uniref:hypothetical protein n=1 Tax=Foetidibacter luteolus TaxID=2608880 RepID=UPI00129B7BCD|nr:hypothetical protein [Foetidibacter luteolus]
MYRLYCVLLLLAFTAGCKSGDKSLAGNEPVSDDDFFAAFSKLALPTVYADTNMLRRADTTTISYAVFNQFVPDSALQKITGKTPKKLSIHPVGMIKKENEFYLLANFTQNKRTKLAVFTFDKQKKFRSSLELLHDKYDDGYRHYVSVNKEPTFSVAKEKIADGSQLLYTRQGYAFNNDAGIFFVVVNDSNEDIKKLSEILNPLDTLPRKNKFSGDYVKDKKNFVSIRDGKAPNKYLFFTHFENKSNDCTGELKGELVIVADNKGIFKETGDPCVIDFSFSGNTVKVKEQGSCGNHRGIKCYFNDSYTRKKEPKKKK